MTPAGTLNSLAWKLSDGSASTSRAATGGPAGCLNPPPAAFFSSLGPSERSPADRMTTMNPARTITRVEERSRGLAEMAAPPARIATVTIVPTRTDVFSPLARNTRDRFTT